MPIQLFKRQRLTLLVGVKNSVTGERLLGAEVLVDGVKVDEQPNDAGLYRIRPLQNGVIEVRARAAGFRSARHLLSARDAGRVKVDLCLDPWPAAEAAVG